MSKELTVTQQKSFEALMLTPLDFWPQKLQPIVIEIASQEGFSSDTLPKAAVIWVKSTLPETK